VVISMKKIFILGLGLLIAGSVSATGLTAQGAYAPSQTLFAQEELQCEMLQAHLIQEGYNHSVPIVMEDEIPSLNGVESWGASFKLRITDAIRNFKNEVDVSDLGITISQADQDAMVDLYQEVMDGNPDLFYATGAFYFSYYKDTTQVQKIIFSYSEYYSKNEAGVLQVDMNKINAYKTARTRALSVVKEGMTDVEKALVLHDYLTLNCAFDYENYLNHERDPQHKIPSKSLSSYGALVDGMAVDSGYAMAYAELLRNVGIPCYVVSGVEYGNTWNLIYVNGNWYHVDVSGDDPVKMYTADYDDMGWIAHDYFLLDDGDMEKIGYHGWQQTNTHDTVPASGNADVFKNTIFRQAAAGGSLEVEPTAFTNFSYYNGYWYYLSYVNGQDPYTDYGYGVITQSKLDGSNVSYWTEEGEFSHLQMMDGRLFYADRMGCYTAGLASDLQPERIITPLGSKVLINCEVEEFVVYGNGTIGVEYADRYKTAGYGKYFVQYYDTNTRETVPMPALKIVKSPTINFTSSPAKKDERLRDGTYTVNYKDGTVYPVSADEIKVFYEEMTNEGVYEVLVEWRGLMTSYQVSLKTDFPIADVLATTANWKYNGIRFVYDNQYMSGVDETHFAPEQSLTRAMLVQILYNMEGEPEVTFSPQFKDVTSDKWYAKAVTWAYTNNIASGYDNGDFGAEDSVTREQTAVILKQYAEMKGIDTAGRAKLEGFVDAGDIHDWAKEAVSWANYHQVLNGKPGYLLDPRGKATRAEMATLIMNFCENVNY